MDYGLIQYVELTGKMKSSSLGWLFFVAILVTSSLPLSQAFRRVNTSVFLSPKIELEPGLVSNKKYYGVDFPRGHIALKSLGTSDISKLNSSDYIFGRNSGICNDGVLDQFFGLGSETRRTATRIPDPYGIEIGNPAENLRFRPGLKRCGRLTFMRSTQGEWRIRWDATNADVIFTMLRQNRLFVALLAAFNGMNRTVYLRYTVEWVDMDTSIIPVKVYIFDVTDLWKRTRNSTGINSEHNCQVEYDIESCRATGSTKNACINDKRVSLEMPFSSYVIYGVGHQHFGAAGSSLYWQGGRVLCSSMPIYGTGKKAGNEAGYVVGMSTCYPKPGSVKISKGDTLILESKYSNMKQHTGLMGLFYLLVADKLP
ncbi:hypothetical protein GQ457_08G033980 [Hibiscus cannabinus]